MIPTSAKRQQQQSAQQQHQQEQHQQEYLLASRAQEAPTTGKMASEGEAEDEEEEEEEQAAIHRQRAMLFNGLSIADQHLLQQQAGNQYRLQYADHADADHVELDDDDEEEDYLRLDTIVEEDENSDNFHDDESVGDNHEDSDCGANTRALATGGDKRRHTQKQLRDSNHRNKEQLEITKQPSTTARPLAESTTTNGGNNLVNNSMRKFNTSNGANNIGQQQQQTKVNNKANIDKCDIQTTTNDDDQTITLTAASALIKQTNGKMQQQQQQPTSGHQLGNALPSTNRLISEHQARQQQTLFRALAERQKMMDELGSNERVDLMSASSLSTSLRAHSTRAGHARSTNRKRRARGPAQGLDSGSSASADLAGGVPLSAVDLSSMSDRMLDELLGHIASASSSSLSSNGESLDSSDMSTTSSDDDDNDDNHLTGALRRARNATNRPYVKRDLHTSDAPNVIGVHEDERTRANGLCATTGQTSSRKLNCRDSHRRSCDNGRDEGDEDDDNNDHELIVHVGAPAGGDLSDSLSPAAQPETPSQQGGRFSVSPTSTSSSTRLTTNESTVPTLLPASHHQSKLEQYFTSGLVNPHDVFSGSASEASDETEQTPVQQPDSRCTGARHLGNARRSSGASVEEVLSRMLEALQEIGTDDQEELNELLERGFSHLEQLLNCSLTPTANGQQQQQQVGCGGEGGNNPSHSSTNINRSQPNLAQKLISSSGSQQHLVMSKDSDYGSDTQSADCFSQYNDNTSESANSNTNQSVTTSTSGGNKWLSQLTSSANQISASNSSQSPSPSSLTTSSPAQNSHSSTTTNQSSTGLSPTSTFSANNKSGGQSSSLSPLAIELSFKLAESLHRLAQQQAARKQQQQASIEDVANKDGVIKQSVAAAGAATDDEDESALILIGQFESSKLQSAAEESRQSSPLFNLHQSAHQSANLALKGATQTTVVPKKSPMKSIVTINATRSPSAASIVSSSSSSLGLAMAQRNMTPVNGDHMVVSVAQDSSSGNQVTGSNQTTTTTPTAQRQQFKTRVNIGTGEVSNVIVAKTTDSDRMVLVCRQSKAISDNFGNDTSKIVSEKQQRVEDLSNNNNFNKKTHVVNVDKHQEEEEDKQVIKVNSGGDLTQASPQTTRNQQVQNHFERRRSARSSLRRRPSFTGSTHSITNGSGAPRPGSPVPRLLCSSQTLVYGSGGQAEETILQKTGELATGTGADRCGEVNGGRVVMMNDDKTKQKQQRQLQRALILAQKYNYSPAKLAASKLSSKLQLKDITSKQDTGIAINGSQTLNQPTWNGHEEPNETLSSKLAGKTPVSKPQHHHHHRHHQQQQQPIKVSGQVQLDISYFAKSGSLTVHVLQCTQLAPVSKRRTTSNPYVKLYLLPDKSKSGKRKSNVHRNQLDPKFDEKFTFGPLQLAEFDDKCLWLSVWHKDRLGRNEFLGEVLLPMSQIRHQLLTSDLCQSTSAKWYQLCERFDVSAAAAAATAASSTTTRGNDQTDLSQSSHNTLTTKPQTNGTNALGHLQGASFDKKQADMDRLNELQRKAVRLTTAVAPSVGAHYNYSNKNTSTSTMQEHSTTLMNVSLGPLAGISPNQTPVTGQLFIALKFVPENQQMVTSRRANNMEGELHIMIKEAHNIAGFESPLIMATTATMSGNDTNKQVGDNLVVRQPLPTGSLPNPFCKCYLLASNGQRVAKQKTPHLKRTANPRWDHKCVFSSVKLVNLSCQAIEILMFNRDSILVSNNEYLGGIRLCRSPPPAAATITATAEGTGVRTTLIGEQLAAAGSDSTSIVSDQSSSTEGATLRRSFTRQDSSAKRAQVTNEIEGGTLCSERESRLWSQMLARPNIWVYGELRLRHLRPLIANGKATATG